MRKITVLFLFLGTMVALILLQDLALEKSPEARYQKVWHLSADLDRYLETKTRSFLRKRVGGVVKKVRNIFGGIAETPSGHPFSFPLP